MGIIDLAVQFLGGRNEELGSHVETLQRELHGLVDEAVDPDKREEVERRVERFPRAALREVADFVGRRHRDKAHTIERRVEHALLRLERGSDDRTIEELEACARDLAALRTDVRRSVRRMSAGIALALVLASAGAYSLRVATKLKRGLEDLNSQIVWPPSAYAAEGSGDNRRLVPVDPYRKRFLAEFGDVYFDGHGTLPPPYGLPSPYWDSDEKGDGGAKVKVDARSPTIVWKSVSRNLSADDAFFVSQVEVEVTCVEKRHFPWDELDVKPELSVEIDFLSGTVENLGSRPAFYLHYTAETEEGLQFASGWLGNLLKGGRNDFKLSSDPDLDCGFRTVDEDGTLSSEVYYRMEDVPEGQAASESYGYEERVIEGRTCLVNDDLWYEVVTTAERLREIATILDEEEFVLRLEYDSLLEEKLELEARGAWVPREALIFAREEALLDRLPVPGDSAAMSVSMSPNPGAWSVAWILGALDPRLRRVQGEGDKVMSFKMRLNLGALDKGERVRQVLIPDQFLAPRGVLTLTCRLDRPKNGTYRIDLFVNGVRTDRALVDMMIPEFLAFDPEHAPGFGIVHAQSLENPWGPKPVFVPAPDWDPDR